MRKLLTTMILMFLPVLSMAETYVCSNSDSDDLYTFTRHEEGFSREGYGTTEFVHVGETNTWLFLNNAQIYQSNEDFQFISIGINKETLEYFVGTHSTLLLEWEPALTSSFSGGKCTEI